MQNFPKNLAEARECLSRVKPWTAIAAVFALVLLAFYSYQGMQYWEAWKETRDMTAEIDRITRKLERGAPSRRSDQDLELQRQRLAHLRSMFEYPEVSRLIGITSVTSWDTDIDLPSISAGEPQSRQSNGMEYSTQVLAVTAKGPAESMYRFLATLHDKVRVVSVPTISLASPGSEAASAQIQLLFYLSPQPISEEEGAD